MMNSVLIVTNFNAGRKNAIKYKKAVIDFVLKFTKTFKFVDIDEFKNTDVAPYDTILSMGGDGTVNKVLPYLVNTDKVLGIIPCGTANLLAAKLGLSSKIKRSLKIIENNNISKIDLMDINGMYSALRCGFGYDADIICKTPQSLKNKFGYFAYFIAGIIFALRLKKKHYSFIIDNQHYETDSSCIIFANASNMYKNWASVGNSSSIDDGYIDIFVLKTANPIFFFIEFLFILLGIRLNSKRAEYLSAKNVHISNTWQVCHIDGEKRNLQNDTSIIVKEKTLKVYVK